MSAMLDPKIIWQPQPKQEAYIACPCFELFFGGARGGGKTDASLGDWLEHSFTYGEHAIGLFVRRRLTQLSEVVARAKQLFIPLGAKWFEQRKEFLMPNGARLKFAYLEKDSDAEEYQGHSYTRVYVEEVTNFPSPSPINLLRATLRSGAGVPVGMRLTGNPGGAGHNWVKARYITPHPAGMLPITETHTFELGTESVTVSLSRVYIPSRITDNQKMLGADPTYLLRLRQSGSEALVKAWLEGNWDIIDGAFFDEFDSSRHILGVEWESAIPKAAMRFRAFDWGSAKPFSVGWYAVSDGTWGLPANAMFKFAEWYGASGHDQGLKMTSTAVAKGIINREKQLDIRCAYGVADPAIFIRNGGNSIAEDMAVEGCYWRRADNKRIAGWSQLRKRLTGGGMDATTDPMLYFSESCIDSIRTIPTLQHSDRDPEDLDTSAEDHAADETRYAVMSRPWMVSGRSTKQAPKRCITEMTINEIMQMQRRLRSQEDYHG